MNRAKPGNDDSVVGPPMGSSDHCTVSFNIKLSLKVPDVWFSRRIYCKDRFNWGATIVDAASINWNNFCRSRSPIDFPNSYLNEIINRESPAEGLSNSTERQCLPGLIIAVVVRLKSNKKHTIKIGVGIKHETCGTLIPGFGLMQPIFIPHCSGDM